VRSIGTYTKLNAVLLHFNEVILHRNEVVLHFNEVYCFVHFTDGRWLGPGLGGGFFLRRVCLPIIIIKSSI
jgi:hypothetical protein